MSFYELADIVFSDFDGDGLADLASANNYSIDGKPASMSVLRNTSTIKNVSFEDTMNISSGVLTYTIAAGDLNGDGKPDLVSTSIADQAIAVFKNTSSPGQISFAPKLSYSTGSNPYSIGIADFDGDGKPDLAVANYFSNTVSIFKNTSVGSTISFASKLDFTTALAPHGLAIGDLDGDEKPDIAIANELSNSVSILKNTSTNGGISFASKVDFAVGGNPITIAVGDLDRDGKEDLAVSNYSTPGFSILRNISTSGAIAFAPKKDFSTSAGPYSVSIGDLNGDGLPDLVVSAEMLNLFQNTSTPGNITFSPRVSLIGFSNSLHIALGDLDGDGKTDLAGGEYIGQKIMLARNKSNEPAITSFTPTVGATGDTITITGTNLALATAVTIGDVPASSFTVVNATTINAVVGPASSGDITVTTPYGTALLSGYVFPGPPTITSFTPTTGTTSTVITITGTNFVGTTEVKFGGVSSTSFIVISPKVIKANVGSGAAGNISISNAYGTATIQGFTFTPPPRITSFSPRNGAVGTIVTLEGENFSPSIQENIVYFGSVKAKVISANSNAISVVAPAGITYEPIRLTSVPNGFITQTSEPFITTFAGNSSFASNSFSEGVTFFRGFNTPGAFGPNLNFVTGDLDDDGKPDIATTETHNYLQTLSILRNTSTPDSVSFDKALLFTKEGEQILIGDLDGDGKLDLVTTEQGATINVFKNTSHTGAISFTIKRVDSSVNNVRVIFGAALGDMDGDGKLDLVLVKSTGEIGILRNTSIEGEISFAKEMSIGSAGEYPYISDLNGDGKPEILSNNGYYETGISIFKNNSSIGNLSFGPRMKLTNGFNIPNIRIADLNGDAMPDLVITESGKVSIYKNASDAANILFTPTNITIPKEVPAIVVINDLDGDSKPDMLLETDKYLSFYKNLSSNGSFLFSSYTRDFLTGDNGLSTADLNMDGRPDIVVMSKDSLHVFANQIGKPINIKACTNGTLTLKSDLNGTNFQWQHNDGNGFRNISDSATFSGTDSISLQLKNIPANWNGHEFRCVVDSGPSSRVYRLVVNNPTDSASVSISASTDTVCKGTSISFTATAVHGGITPSYQWQVNNVQVGTNSNSFTSASLNNNDQVKVILNSNASCVINTTASSNIIRVTVNSDFLPQGKALSIHKTCISDSFVVTFKSINIPNGSSVELWESVNGGAFTSVATSIFVGNDIDVKRNSSVTGLNKYFFKITPSSATTCGKVNNSDTASISIEQIAVPSTVVSDNMIVITNPDANAAYQWQVKEMNANWVDIIPFATGIIFTADTSGTYRVKAEKGACIAFSNEQKIRVMPSSTAPEVYYGPNPTTGKLRIDSLKLSDQWQTLEILSTDGSQSFGLYNIANQTSVTLHLEFLRPGLYFAVLRRSNGAPVVIRFIKL